MLYECLESFGFIDLFDALCYNYKQKEKYIRRNCRFSENEEIIV